MRSFNKMTALLCTCIVFSTVLFPGLSSGITIKEEEELATEFLKYLQAQFTIIDDPLIVNYINQLGTSILKSFPQQPFEYNFYVIKEDVYNAFATPGGHIFVYSGLIAAMEHEDELAGILGHEISHVYCRHISQKIEHQKKINMATLAGVAAGIFLGVAGGGQAAGVLTAGSVAAGQTAALANSREDEIQADQIGLDHLIKAGYSGEGLLDALNTIRAKQWYGTDQVPTYMMTHPALEDRLAYIDTYLSGDSQRKGAELKKDSFEFQVVRARIIALYTDEKLAVQKLAAEVRNHPDDPVANYGYGLALVRSGNRTEGIAHLKKAVEMKAFDATFIAALGRAYFSDGRYEEALGTLRSAVSISPNDAESLFYLGRSQLELGQIDEAARSFESLLKVTPLSDQTLYFLGKTKGMQGQLADAYYYLGLYHYRKGDFKTAHAQLTQALAQTTDAERRQEIEKLVAQTKKLVAESRRSRS
jgi:predicted Zn-dependent protease